MIAPSIFLSSSNKATPIGNALSKGDSVGHEFHGNRYTGGLGINKEDHILRGVVVDASRANSDLQSRLVNGKASAEDVLSLVNPSHDNSYWLSHNATAEDQKETGNIKEAKYFATPFTTKQNSIEKTGVVLVAEKPKGNGGFTIDRWYPKDSGSVALKEIHYNTGNGWNKISASGKSIAINPIAQKVSLSMLTKGAPFGNTNAAKDHVSQTDSKEFKQWFGDSKIVDDNGKPLVVYHGTKRDFTEFKAGYADGLSFFTTNPAFAGSWPVGSGGLREGPPGTQEEYDRQREVANTLAQQMMTPTDQYDFNTPEGKAQFNREYDALHDEIQRQTGFRNAGEFESKAGIQVMPVYLSIQQPYDATKDYKEVENFLRGNGQGDLVDRGYHKTGNWIVYERPDVINFLKSKGYDGIWINENTDGPQETIAPFSNTQIKSASGNKGTWELNNPDITKSSLSLLRKGAPFGNDNAAKDHVMQGKDENKVEAPKDNGDVDRFINQAQNTNAYKQAQAELDKLESETKSGDVTTWSKEQNQVNGEYTKERQALHEEIINKALTEDSKVTDGTKPVAVFLIGQPGAGKTTSSKEVLANITDRGLVTINADDVKAKLTGYNGINAGAFHEESSDVAEKQLLPRALEGNHNLLLDAVGKDSVKMNARADQLARAGYDVHVINVTTEPYKSLDRVYNRFLGPEKRFVNLEYASKVDHLPDRTYDILKNNVNVKSWHQFDNTGASPRLLDKGSR